jgi:hypothetical protein
MMIVNGNNEQNIFYDVVQFLKMKENVHFK